MHLFMTKEFYGSRVGWHKKLEETVTFAMELTMHSRYELGLKLYLHT
jgi:hypothetical protein